MRVHDVVVGVLAIAAGSPHSRAGSISRRRATAEHSVCSRTSRSKRSSSRRATSARILDRQLASNAAGTLLARRSPANFWLRRNGEIMGDDKKTNPTGSEHHSKVKGAVVGGAVGG